MAEQTPKRMPPGVWDLSAVDGYRRFESFDNDGRLVTSYVTRSDLFDPQRCEDMRRELVMVNRNLQALAALPEPLKLLA